MLHELQRRRRGDFFRRKIVQANGAVFDADQLDRRMRKLLRTVAETPVNQRAFRVLPKIGGRQPRGLRQPENEEAEGDVPEFSRCRQSGSIR